MPRRMPLRGGVTVQNAEDQAGRKKKPRTSGLDAARVAEMRIQGKSYQEIADGFGVTRQAVQFTLKRLETEAAALSGEGLSVRSIANRLGITPTVAQHALNGFGAVPLAKDGRSRRSAWQSEAVRLASEGIDPADVAVKVGRSEDHVRRVVRDAGVALSRRASDGDRDEILRLRGEGLIYREIAERTGWSIAMVEKVCHEAGIQGTSKSRRKRAVTEEDEREILRLADENLTQAEIAQRTGWSPSLVSKVIRHAFSTPGE